MSPRLLALLVAILVVIVVGMALTVKRSAEKSRARDAEIVVPAAPKKPAP